jgi:SAM-dependent methyltransferase
MKDPLGAAIEAYCQKPSKKLEIIVHSKLCDDDVIPVHHLFRTYTDFPTLEKIAIDACRGKILDVGAGAGAHAIFLNSKGFDVKAIDISIPAIDYIQSKGVKSQVINFFDIQGETYDTILMLMNGIGIAGTLSNLENTLLKSYQLLNDNGQLLLDSSDISYLYEEEDGSTWMDLNSEYYGNFDYQMEFKGVVGEWFKWLFVDLENLKQVAEKVGFKVTLLTQEESQFLVRLIKEENTVVE